MGRGSSGGDGNTGLVTVPLLCASRYIKNLLANSQYLGSVEPSLAVQEQGHFSSSVPIKAHQWLSPEVIQQNSGNLANALWTLRDHMMRDSLKLAQVIDEF